MTKKKNGGFTLVEVLISLVVLSLGLLGTAGLYLTTVRHSHSAYLRSQAALSAYSIIDRMRANRAGAISGSYDIALSSIGELSTPGNGIVEIDRYDWFRELDATLPGGKGAIDCSAGAVCSVTVQWDDSRAEGATALEQQTLAAQL